MRLIWLAEFIGTFFLVFLGCGSLIAAESGLIVSSHAALVFGGTVLAMVATFGHISYAHFNPAVTVGFFVLKQVTFSQLLIYWSAEFTGAIVASGLHAVIFGTVHSFGANTPTLSLTSAFTLEVIGTFMLMGVITVVATDERVHKSLPALSIGTTVALISWVIGPLSGGSFNPARTIGPALMSGNFAHLPLYFFAPILGSFLAALSMKQIIRRETCPHVGN